jgi:hypothetical protein
METTQTNKVDSSTSDEKSIFQNYLPAGPSPSSEPGRVEQFVTNLFRRRGGYRHVVRRTE